MSRIEKKSNIKSKSRGILKFFTRTLFISTMIVGLVICVYIVEKEARDVFGEEYNFKMFSENIAKEVTSSLEQLKNLNK